MSLLPVLILGAGGHAKVLIEALQRSQIIILGIIDPIRRPGELVSGVPVIGNDEEVRQYTPAEIKLVNGIGSVGNNTIRKSLFLEYKKLGYTFQTVIHPSAILPCEYAIGEGSQIMAGVVLQPGVSIGINTIINTGSRLDHDCQIGNHCHIAPGVTLSGGVLVGEDSHLGTGAVAIQSVKIGANVLVAAGATVTKDIESGHIVYAARTKKIKLEERKNA